MEPARFVGPVYSGTSGECEASNQHRQKRLRRPAEQGGAVSIRSSLALAAIALFVIAVPGVAADKPTDPQIAHIAYTAG